MSSADCSVMCVSSCVHRRVAYTVAMICGVQNVCVFVCVCVRVFVCGGSVWGRGSSVHVVIVSCVGIECTGVVWCCQYWWIQCPWCTAQ